VIRLLSTRNRKNCGSPKELPLLLLKAKQAKISVHTMQLWLMVGSKSTLGTNPPEGLTGVGFVVWAEEDWGCWSQRP